MSVLFFDLSNLLLLLCKHPTCCFEEDKVELSERVATAYVHIKETLKRGPCEVCIGYSRWTCTVLHGARSLTLVDDTCVTHCVFRPQSKSFSGILFTIAAGNSVKRASATGKRIASHFGRREVFRTSAKRVHTRISSPLIKTRPPPRGHCPENRATEAIRRSIILSTISQKLAHRQNS